MAAGTALCTGTVTSSIRVENNARTYQVRYIVATTDVDDQGITATRASGIPRTNDHYRVGNDSDAGAFPSEYAPRLINAEGDRKTWEVLVTFSTRDSSSGGSSGGDPFEYELPWLEPARVVGSGLKMEELARVHYTNPGTGANTALTNSAGALLDDEYVDRANYMISLEVKYRYNDWSLQTTGAAVNRINDRTFFSGPAGYYKMAAPRWALLFTGEGVPYWDVTYEFEGYYGGWNGVEKMDEGYWYIDWADFNRMKRFADDMGLPISGKGRLDGAGDRLDPRAAPVFYPPGGINKYRETNFGSLGIPVSFAEVVNNSFSRKQ